MDSKWYTIQYVDNSYAVLIDDMLRVIKNGNDVIKQNWLMRRYKWGHNIPTENIDYKMKLSGEFKLYECQDADCPLTGCKHSSCYWADYTELGERVQIMGIENKDI